MHRDSSTMQTFHTLDDSTKQQAQGRILVLIRLAANGRKSIYKKAVDVLAMTNDQILENFEAAGAPGLPYGYDGDEKAFADYCRFVTADCWTRKSD